MREIDKRLEKLERKLKGDDSVGEETIEQIIETAHFKFYCITERVRLQRDLNAQDKLAIVERLPETGLHKTLFPELLIRWLGEKVE